jgi:hypothetical protein
VNKVVPIVTIDSLMDLNFEQAVRNTITGKMKPQQLDAISRAYTVYKTFNKINNLTSCESKDSKQNPVDKT